MANKQADFDFLQSAELSETVQYTIAEIKLLDKHPILTVKQANKYNSDFFPAFQRDYPKLARKIQIQNRSETESLGILPDALQKEIVSADKDLFSKYVITGWENVVDGEGKAVKFSQKSCANFLEKLPDWIFDRLRTFCGNVNNFRPASTLEIKETAKN